MKVLVINAGSSSLKYQLMDPATREVFAKGLCERIGIDGRLTHKVPAKDAKYEFEIPMPTHSEAIQAVLDALLDALPGVHTTIITGNNRKLYDRLAGKYAHIEVLGFTDRVYDYMARADLVLTKPGGITLFETIFSELPILAWEPFLEQEKNNARFLVKRGLGRVAAKEPEECLSAIRALIYDDETLEWMAGNMRAMKGQLEEESLNRMLAGLEAEKGVRVG